MARSLAPQIIPKWAISHLGKKVRFVRQYCDGYRIWYPDQTATLDGLQVGADGVECVIYFDDYDDQCYIVESADLFAPVYDEDEKYDDFSSGRPDALEGWRQETQIRSQPYFSDRTGGFSS